MLPTLLCSVQWKDWLPVTSKYILLSCNEIPFRVGGWIQLIRRLELEVGGEGWIP